ncbi:hypothetical protein UFOVP225_17 [uncultured Caudovirales phage]|uniref:Uncharacterized protein n=1 Tax=uncultured Caudovirales phage TaxID=2100421 RepID=A0A6J7WMG3_9CAUD|nr:hypothetical protein UFOVP113_30 [uncultured Caudovirales phage]CAB5219036.1 hypothetical protein UFOVP225_17 [uncultured Caudovirales phage]
MSSLDRDQYRKVSQFSEMDFIRGMADSVSKGNGTANLLAGLAVGFLVNKAVRWGK